MQLKNRKETDFDSGLDLGTETFDVYGGAVGLLERQLAQLVDHVSGDLVSGDNTRRVSLVVLGGAGVLLENRQHAV